MRHLLPAILFAAVPLPLLAQSSPPLSDFRLEPEAREPEPRAQGPVDDSAPVPVAPRVLTRPAPQQQPVPQRPAPQQPTFRLPEPAPSTAPAAPTERRPAPPAADPSRQALPAAQRPAAPAGAAPSGTVGAVPLPPVPPPLPLPPPEPTLRTPVPQNEEAAVAGDSTSLPVWAVGLLAIVAALGAAFWWRRRRSAAAPLTIEKPTIGGGAGATSAEPLKVELTAVKLTRSLMNATLAYRVTLLSRSTGALTGIGVAGELVAAHGSQPLESQIASAAADLPQLHQVDRLAPGQTRVVEGTLTLPLSNVIPIRQGQAALFVPLLRLLVTADGAEPLARTFVVGLPGQGVAGRLQPFRLDEPPRSYAPVGQRALD